MEDAVTETIVLEEIAMANWSSVLVSEERKRDAVLKLRNHPWL